MGGLQTHCLWGVKSPVISLWVPRRICILWVPHRILISEYWVEVSSGGFGP